MIKLINILVEEIISQINKVKTLNNTSEELNDFFACEDAAGEFVGSVEGIREGGK
jgi:hypothetical protein